MEQHVLDTYNSAAGANSYTRKFEKRWTERINNVREQRLVRSLLREMPRSETALDMPSGYGRLFPLVKSVSTNVVEGDWSFYMLSEAQRHLAHSTSGASPLGFVRATALSLPYANRSFDLVFSARLCHHIDSREERLRYVGELLRVSSRSVIFTYFDADSVKNRIHRLRGRVRKQRAKFTLDRKDVEQLANGFGFEITRSVPLSRLFSGHRYTVLNRRI